MKTNLKVAFSNVESKELSKVEQLVKEYRAADRSSQTVLEKATEILSSSRDSQKVAQANRAVKLSSALANDAFLKVVEQKSDSLRDVLEKLDIWHESVVGEQRCRETLSPMEQLLCSVIDDVAQLSGK